jgi:DNA primase
MSRRLEDATPSFTYLLDRTIEKDGLETPEHIRRVAAEVFNSLQNIQSRLNVDLRLKELAERIGVSLDSIRRDWDRFLREHQQRKGPVAVEKGPGSCTMKVDTSRATPFEEARKGLLTLLLLSAEDLDKAMGQTFATHPTTRKLLGEALDTLRRASEVTGLHPLIETYLEEGPSAVQRKWYGQEDNPLRWEMEADLREKRIPENPLRTLRDYTHVLRKTEIDKQIVDCKNALLAAEKSHEWEKVGLLATRVDALVKERESILSQSMEEVG